MNRGILPERNKIMKENIEVKKQCGSCRYLWLPIIEMPCKDCKIIRVMSKWEEKEDD
jgi:hypothetical protein